MLITIFTPTYNRGYIIGKLYRSILRQNAEGFEWLIVDDGSTDNTPQLIEQWQRECADKFPIRYVRQINSGKHVAWNKALKEAKGDVFFPVDSDDYLTDDALNQIRKMLMKVKPDDSNIIAVSGVRSFPEGKLTGGILQSAETDYIDYSSIDRRSKGISGDLAEVFFTSKIRQYPFPSFPDERFVPEAVVFNRFSNDGMLIRGFKHPLYHCEYLEDGYTRNVDKLLISNWKGYKLYIKELMHSRAGVKAKTIPFCGFLYRWLLKTFRIVH